MRHYLAVGTALAAVAIAAAPAAAAAPDLDCVQVAPNTTQCTRAGHTAITTSPPPNPWANYGPLFYGGWGGGIVIGGR